MSTNIIASHKNSIKVFDYIKKVLSPRPPVELINFLAQCYLTSAHPRAFAGDVTHKLSPDLPRIAASGAFPRPAAQLPRLFLNAQMDLMTYPSHPAHHSHAL